MPYKKHAVAIRAVADETGTRKEWVEQVCRDAPPPNILVWADRWYLYSLARGSVFHKILGYVARFMEMKKVSEGSRDGCIGCIGGHLGFENAKRDQ